MMKKWNKLIMLLSLYLVCASYAKKSAKDWSKIDYDAIDESWTEGDEEDELLTEDELLFRDMERRKSSLDISDMDETMLQHGSSMTGPTMLFVELNPIKGGYSEDFILDLSGQWRDLLHTGGITAMFYNIEENKLLASLQKGWDGEAVKDFLLTRNEVIKVTWDNIDYKPQDENKPPSIKKKPSKKGKKNSKKKANKN